MENTEPITEQVMKYLDTNPLGMYYTGNLVSRSFTFLSPKSFQQLTPEEYNEYLSRALDLAIKEFHLDGKTPMLKLIRESEMWDCVWRKSHLDGVPMKDKDGNAIIEYYLTFTIGVDTEGVYSDTRLIPSNARAVLNTLERILYVIGKEYTDNLIDEIAENGADSVRNVLDEHRDAINAIAPFLDWVEKNKSLFYSIAGDDGWYPHPEHIKSETDTDFFD